MLTTRAGCGWCLGLATALVLALSCAAPVQAQQTPDGAWLLVPDHPPAAQAQEPWIRPNRGQALVADLARLQVILSAAPLEFAQQAPPALMLQIPDPDGVLRTFRVEESPVMEPGLAAQFPDIKTYVGQGVDDRAATLRADVTMFGFHAQILDPDGDWYIDPYSRANTTDYTSYYRRDLPPPAQPMVCQGVVVDPQAQGGPPPFTPRFTNGTMLRTYRLALACTGEYAAFFGGTVAGVQAAMATAVNRVTGVYEKDVACRLVLVANNASLIYLNASTDPYSNTNGSAMLTQNVTTVNSVIGSANYDIGHVFSTGGGGIAGLGVICGSNKAQGVTGSPSPTGDAFYIDYVAHEMGHEFGANHDFNSTTSNCGGGNRNASTAYEIGSGSTIMPYAGICGADDLQPHSDAYFHAVSLGEIISKFTMACATQTPTGNHVPTITVPAAATIPIGTPFALTASSTDADGDALTYCWEEYDLGVATTVAAADNGSSPIIRSQVPSASGTRYFPKLATILANTTDNAEKRPAVARSAFHFRCTVRDNRANGGAVFSGDTTLVVSAAAGPFLITSPGSGSFSGATTVSWNVANTSASPVSCASVKISLSTDGGNTFPTVLLASTPNTGSVGVTLPDITASAARIKVEAVGNYFFDISHANFSITPTSLTGACCGASGACSTISQTQCTGIGGAYQGDGVSCINPSPCAQPTGACCESASGLCTTATSAACIAAAKTYQGDGVACANPNPCPQPLGACCAAGDGSCAQTTAAACASGYQGINTTCASNPCLPPSGACCAPNGDCTSLTSAQCAEAGNTFQGSASTCSANPCVPVTYLVSITKTGSGRGVVTSQPGAISCGGICADYFVVGANITLVAAANSDSAFVGWTSGPCSGTGNCVTTVTGPLNIVAAFRCKADFNNDGVATVSDIFAYLTSWFSGSLAADFNGDNIVNVADIFAFLAGWFAGC